MMLRDSCAKTMSVQHYRRADCYGYRRGEAVGSNTRHHIHYITYDSMRIHSLYFVLFLAIGSMSMANAQDGEALFKANCAACHSIGKGKLVGPDLKGVIDRHPEVWLQKWIRSSQSLVKAGDPDAVKLFNDNMQIVMPDQIISDDEINAIIAYFKTHPDGEKKQVAALPTVGEDGHTLANPESHKQVQEHEGSLVHSLGFGGYLGMMLSVLALVVVLVVLLSAKSTAEEQRHSQSEHA